MTRTEITEKFKLAGRVKIRHKFTGVYYLERLVDIKVNNIWVKGALYYGEDSADRYVREMGDFELFTYIDNEVIGDGR